MAYLLDCQSDLLFHLSHSLTVPLVALDDAPVAAARLNPVFTIEGRSVVMLTQFASAVPKTELRDPVVSLAHHDLAIIAAIDVLLGGV